ncbi:MAG TPA: ABC transporter permease [Syntrophorhabdaceae bacterium]|nr:ABC transporter permease [Syntrophorhabdaceae bacterium]
MAGKNSTDNETRKAEQKIKFRMLIRRIPKIPAAIILLLFISSVSAQWIAPHDPTAQTLLDALKPPVWLKGGSASYILGTDALGRDVLSRIIYGSRVSVIVGFAGVLLSAFVGTLLGMIAGYSGGKIDSVIMRFTDMMLSMPYILIAMAIIAAIGPSLTNIIIALALCNWVGYTRIIRFESMKLSTAEFVDMAVISGSGRFRNLFVHILPNVLNTVLVLATLDVGKMIIFEAALSFLGLGVQPPTVTWGGLCADGRSNLSFGWWIATFPGIAIVMTCLAGNLIGDWLRDELDPRHQLRT